MRHRLTRTLLALLAVAGAFAGGLAVGALTLHPPPEVVTVTHVSERIVTVPVGTQRFTLPTGTPTPPRDPFAAGMRQAATPTPRPRPTATPTPQGSLATLFGPKCAEAMAEQQRATGDLDPKRQATIKRLAEANARVLELC